MESNTEIPLSERVTIPNGPEFPTLTELKDKNLDADALTADLEKLAEEFGTGEEKNRHQRRHATDGKLTGHSKHSRFMWINGKLTKFHMTKQRPWVKRDENRKRDRIAKASRVKNR